MTCSRTSFYLSKPCQALPFLALILMLSSNTYAGYYVSVQFVAHSLDSTSHSVCRSLFLLLSLQTVVEYAGHWRIEENPLPLVDVYSVALLSYAHASTFLSTQCENVSLVPERLSLWVDPMTTMLLLVRFHALMITSLLITCWYVRMLCYPCHSKNAILCKMYRI